MQRFRICLETRPVAGEIRNGRDSYYNNDIPMSIPSLEGMYPDAMDTRKSRLLKQPHNSFKLA